MNKVSMADEPTQKPPEAAQPAPSATAAQPNRLGLNKWIYAAGYSAKDGYLWGGVSFLATAGLMLAGKWGNITPIENFTKILEKGRQWLENQKKTVGLEGPVFTLAAAVSFVIGHAMIAPSGRVGYKKAEALIGKHERVIAEKDQLVESGKLLKEENDQLKAALATAQGSRPSHAKQISAGTSAAPQVSP